MEHVKLAKFKLNDVVQLKEAFWFEFYYHGGEVLPAGTLGIVRGRQKIGKKKYYEVKFDGASQIHCIRKKHIRKVP